MAEVTQYVVEKAGHPKNLLSLKDKRTIANCLGGGKSLEVVVPQDATEIFLEELIGLFQDEEKGVPAVAKHAGRKVPTIKIIRQSGSEIDEILSEFQRKKDENLHTPWTYAANVHELNVWINPDYTVGDNQLNGFSTMAKYAQSLYLFDHDYEFGELSPQLKAALGGDTAMRLVVGQK